MANFYLKPDFDPAKFKTTVERALAQFISYQRLAFDRNILKQIGRHWLQLSKSSMSWRSESRHYRMIDKRYPMPVTNYVGDKIKTVKANLLRTFPTPYATHRVRSQRAEQAARYLDTAIKYFHDAKSLRYKRKIDDTAGWCLATGGCIWIPYWNLDSGKFIDEYETEIIENKVPVQVKACMNCGKPDNPPNVERCLNCNSADLSLEMQTQTMTQEVDVLDEFGEKVVKERIPVGDPGLEIAPYYEWVFHPRHDELDDCPWIMRRTIKTVDYFKDVYDEDVEAVTRVPDELNYKQRINAWVSGSVWHDYATSSYYTNFLNDAVVETHLWIKPGQKLSDDGKHYVFGGEKVVHEERFIEQGALWKNGKYPFVHIRYSKIPGRMYGKGIVDDLAPVNDMINRIDQALEWNRRQQDPITVTYVGGGATPEQMTGRYGRHLVINQQGLEPKFLSPPPLPQQVWLEREKRERDINALSVSDTFSGQIESRTPAMAMNMALEQSAAKLTEFYRNMLDGDVEYWESVRVLLKENLTTERAFSIMGDGEDEYESVAFLGNDLDGDSEHDDGGVIIKISHDDIYPQSRSALKQMIVEGLKNGTYNPQDPFQQAVVNKILGLDREGINKSFNVHVSAANRAIMLMSEGIDIISNNVAKYGAPLKPSEKPDVLAEVVGNFMVTERFDRLPSESQRLFLIYYQQVTQIAKQQREAAMEEQLMKAMASKGSSVKM